MDFELCTRYLGGEYTAKWRDVELILGSVKGLILDADLSHILRILDHGYPAKFNWEESAKKEEIFIPRGNNQSVNKNIEVINKTLHEDDRKSHVIHFP